MMVRMPAFYVVGLGNILKKYQKQLKALPRGTPFYELKSNESGTIVKSLVAIGMGSDCASKTVPSIGEPPENIL